MVWIVVREYSSDFYRGKLVAQVARTLPPVATFLCFTTLAQSILGHEAVYTDEAARQVQIPIMTGTTFDPL